ncbi:MAG: tetratricopeptide repeat protein [Verrucomicrobia bacterium]|nr:tetratricopeptide repeat protein [Verrucomicrobiota bacterium]
MSLQRCFTRRAVAVFAGGLAALALMVSAAPAAEVNVNDLLRQAHTAYKLDNRPRALALADKAVETEPKNPQTHLFRGNLHSSWREREKAVANFTRALELDASLAAAFQQRGAEHFRLGKIKESIADFDRFIALNPKQEPHHWQRGISCYYAGRFADGVRQFESHQTVNPNDVENAVWHFLCAAKLDGIEKARQKLIPIRGDSRIPMMQVHALFAGKLKPDDVMAAARAGDPPPSQLEPRLFYAHLYLGLYFDALGDEAKAREFINKAAASAERHDYMGDVARVHAEMLRRKAGEK